MEIKSARGRWRTRTGKEKGEQIKRSGGSGSDTAVTETAKQRQSEKQEKAVRGRGVRQALLRWRWGDGGTAPKHRADLSLPRTRPLTAASSALFSLFLASCCDGGEEVQSREHLWSKAATSASQEQKWEDAIKGEAAANELSL